jgi:hypothetical protein
MQRMPLKGDRVVRASHKPGMNSGVDYGLIIVFLLWITAIIGFMIMFALKGHASEFLPVQRPCSVPARNQALSFRDWPAVSARKSSN